MRHLGGCREDQRQPPLKRSPGWPGLLKSSRLLFGRLRVRVDVVGSRADLRSDPARLLRLLDLLLRDPLALFRLLGPRVRFLPQFLRLLAPLRLLTVIRAPKTMSPMTTSTPIAIRIQIQAAIAASYCRSQANGARVP